MKAIRLTILIATLGCVWPGVAGAGGGADDCVGTPQKAGLDPDCSITTTQTLIRQGIDIGYGDTHAARRVAWKAWAFVRDHQGKLVNDAQNAYYDGKKMSRFLDLARKGHRILKHSSTPARAFGGWIRNNGPRLALVAKHFGKAAAFCVVPGVSVYLWHRFHNGDSHAHSIGAAQDGCVGGAATYLLSLKAK